APSVYTSSPTAIRASFHPFMAFPPCLCDDVLMVVSLLVVDRVGELPSPLGRSGESCIGYMVSSLPPIHSCTGPYGVPLQHQRSTAVSVRVHFLYGLLWAAYFTPPADPAMVGRSCNRRL